MRAERKGGSPRGGGVSMERNASRCPQVVLSLESARNDGNRVPRESEEKNPKNVCAHYRVMYKGVGYDIDVGVLDQLVNNSFARTTLSDDDNGGEASSV